jgi:hypothetical protein
MALGSIGNHKNKGVFLGAGASYEAGMPLVWEFSNTLRKNVLNRLDSKLFNFGSELSLKSFLINVLSDESKHYEEVVGELEQLYINKRANSSPVHGVLIQLIECIQILFLEEQMNTLNLLGEAVKDYYGLVDIIAEQGLLNVFSLNHDIVFEEICDYYDIPYRDGFFNLEHNYKNTANFRVVTKEQLESSQINLYKPGESGVNLIKLHGSIDIFAAENKKLFLKVAGDGGGVGSHFNEIRKVEDANLDICTLDGVRATNELCVYDDNNELQFLRRSLLSGAHKFKNKFEQVAPIALFDTFKKQLYTVNELIVVGYGFGDSHINDALGLWINDKSNEITIYDPYRESVPECLSSFSSQVDIVRGGLSDFFFSANSSKDNMVSKIKRKIFGVIRENLMERRLAK